MAAALSTEPSEAFRRLLDLDVRNIEPLSRQPAEILPHLLLGSCDFAQNVELLRHLGVTHVLNCAAASVRTGPGLYEPLGIGYTEFVSEDAQGYNIMQHYDQLATLADEAAAAKGRLFVHCEAGVNRSGSLCVAYHTVTSGMPLLDSARHCKARRGRICTNKSFQRQVWKFVEARGLPLE